MKILPVLILFCAMTGVSITRADEVSTLLQEAQRANAGGHPETAEILFRRVLEIQPNNTMAKNYLRTIEATKKTVDGGLKAAIAGLRLDSVEMKDVTLNAALDYLTQLGSKASGGKIVVSFVQKLPPEFSEKKVTLNLKGVPMSEALRYVGSLTDTSFTVEQYAIIVTPASTPSSATNVAPATGSEPKLQGL